MPELEPLDGVVIVSEVAARRPGGVRRRRPAGPFALAAGDRLVGRLDEHPFLDEDEHDDDGHQH